MNVRVVAFRAAAIGVGLLIALALVELGLRLFHLATAGGVATVSVSEYHRVPGLFLPNQRVREGRRRALPFAVRIDSLGYRGADFPRVKPAGEFRIVMVGDSFTFGDFVEDDETLPAQLHQLLADRCPGVRVVNAGVGGTTIITHGIMAARAAAIDLDLVVLTFSENDIDDLVHPLWYGFEANRRLKSRFPLSLLYPVLRRTALWNFALDLRARLAIVRRGKAGAGSEEPLEARAATEAARVPLRRRYADALVKLRDELAERGVPLLFAAYPSHHSLVRQDRVSEMGMVDAAEAASIPVANVLSAFEESQLGVEQLFLLPEDGHPRARGHAIAARRIAQRILELPMLQQVCEGSAESPSSRSPR